jgi:large subunit ribosomal protein L32
MAVPKKKTSHMRKGTRRAHWHLAMPSAAKCSHCGATCRPHRVCRACGHYGAREVIVVEKS